MMIIYPFQKWTIATFPEKTNNKYWKIRNVEKLSIRKTEKAKNNWRPRLYSVEH